MKKLLIIFAFGILMSSFALAATLSISPGTLILSGKANEEICNNLTLKYSISGTVEGNNLWASQGTEKRLGLYNLKAEDLGITVTYPTQVYLTGNLNKEIEICVTAQNQGTFQGALFYVPAYGTGNQAPGVGTWFSVNIEGIANEVDVPGHDILQFNANEPKSINANQISIEVTTQKTVSGNVNVVEHTQNIENPDLIGIATPNDITADPEIANNLKSAVIKSYYNEDEIIFKNVDENSLKLYYYNPSSIKWDELDSTVNPLGNYVQASITHFSIYGIFGSEIENTDLDEDLDEDDTPERRSRRSKSSDKETRMVTIVDTPPTCIGDWSCTEWSKCINKKQTRICEDKKKCGNTINKPVESRSCIIKKTNPTPLTEHAIATPNPKDSFPNVLTGISIVLSIIIFGILSYALIGYIRKTRK